jgi:hypothetical protein
VSREGAPSKQPKRQPAAGTPIWVWVVYAFGILAGAIFVFSALFTLGALVLSNDVPVGTDVSTPAIVLWGGLIVAAVVTWIVRRRQRR